MIFSIDFKQKSSENKKVTKNSTLPRTFAIHEIALGQKIFFRVYCLPMPTSRAAAT